MEPDHMTTQLPIPDILTVYGASWCGDCRNTRRYLDGAGVAYRYVDLGLDVTAQALPTTMPATARSRSS